MQEIDLLRAAPVDLEDEDILEMLNSGLIQVAVTHAYLPKLSGHIYTNIGPHPDMASDNDSVAWAMRKGSPQLISATNDFIRTHKLGTTFGNAVVQRYTVNTQILKNATSPDDLKRFEQIFALFRKYAAQYNVDYLLVMAEGFQESSLSQQAKSKVGAVGITQLMPATSEQMKVDDITQLDANVHAGVKTFASWWTSISPANR